MQHIETPAEAMLDSRGGHKLWNETMKHSVSHSKTPTSENKPGGDVHSNDRDNKLVRHLISECNTKARECTDMFWYLYRLQHIDGMYVGLSYV